MWSKYAIISEPTIDCDNGLYFGVECPASGKYALIDLTKPVSDCVGWYFCVAHLCPEHALSVLKLSHNSENLEDRRRAKELGSKGEKAE